MSASGRNCRKIDRRSQTDADTVDVDVSDDSVVVRVRGRVVRRVRGGDPERVLRQLQRKERR